MGGEPVVLEVERVAFELTETITTEESSQDWHTVLVFCVYEERGGGGLTLCEVRVEVKHEDGRTWVWLVGVTDCVEGRGDLLQQHWRGYAANKRTGPLDVPETGRAMLTDERPVWQNLSEAVKVLLGAAARVYRLHGPVPLPKREEESSVSVLHTGSETGRSESKHFYNGTWKAACETRSYELEDGTRVYVTVFLADFIEGMGARSGSSVPLPVTGAYQYAVQVDPGPEYSRLITAVHGDLDKERLTPAMPGETRTLLAWEAALDVAEKILNGES